MKKFASLLISGLLVAGMAFSGVVSSFASTPAEVDKEVGSLSLTKYDPSKITEDEDGNIVAKDESVNIYVEGSTFSAYRVLDFNGKVFTINEKFVDAGVTVESLVNVSSTEAGYISYGTTSDLEAQISKIQAFTADNNVEATQQVTTDANGQAKFADLPLGVYLVAETSVPEGYAISTQSFLVTIPQWNQDDNDGNGAWQYDIEAKPKNLSLQVVKNITSSDNSSSDSYEIGDKIDYQVYVNVPNYGMSTDYPSLKLTDSMAINDPKNEGVAKFNKLNLVFEDTFTAGLTPDLSSVNLIVGETQMVTDDMGVKQLVEASYDNEGKANLVYSDGCDYTAELVELQDGSTKLVVDLAWAAVNELQGQKILLTYSAQLNNKAVAGVANNNTVVYEFSNDPLRVPAGPDDDPTRTTTTDDDNDVYTFGMDLTKEFDGISATDAQVDASGITFEIQKDGKVMNLIKNADGNYSIWTGRTAVVDEVLCAIELFDEDEDAEVEGEETTDESESTEPEETPAPETYSVVGEIVTSANPTSTGSLDVKGFEAGKYDLVEIASIDGYTLLTSPITLLIEEVLDDVDSTVVTATVNASVVGNDGTNQPLEMNEDNVGIFKISVNNPKKQFNLPQTGGLGLWMFTITGGIIMAGAIIFMSVLRKKDVA